MSVLDVQNIGLSHSCVLKATLCVCIVTVAYHIFLGDIVEEAARVFDISLKYGREPYRPVRIEFLYRVKL